MENGSIWQKMKRWLPGILISVIAFSVVINLSNWADLKTAFTGIQAKYLLFAGLILIISLLLRAQCWRTLLKNKATLWQTFKVLNVGYLINNVFPFRAGEIGRAIFMGQITNLGAFHVLSTIVLERSFDLIFAAILLLITLPLALGLDWAKPLALSALILVLFALILLFLVAKNNQVVSSWIRKIGARWVFVDKYLLPRIDSLLNGLSVLTDFKLFSLSVFWMVLVWMTAIITDYILLLPFEPDSQIWWAAFMMGVLSVGVAIPSAPAALGVYEASVVAALSILGVSYSNALAYGIIVHFFSFAFTGFFGLIGLAQEGKSLSTILEDIRFSKSVSDVTADGSGQE